MCLESYIGVCMASLAHPSLVGQARKPISNSPTLLFLNGNLSIKETHVTVLILINSGFETKPMVSYASLYRSTQCNVLTIWNSRVNMIDLQLVLSETKRIGDTKYNI